MRAYLRQVRQYNHRYGCDWCLIEAGGAMAREFHNHSQQEINRLLRKKKDFMDFKDYFENNENHLPPSNNRFNGINGISPLLCLHDFDIVRGISVEPMHSISLGVFRKLLNGIINTDAVNIFAKNITRTIFIKEMSQRLIQIKGLTEMPRTPRHLDQLKFWKSCEFDTFLSYYFYPTSYGLLKLPVIRHVSTLARIYYLAHIGPVGQSVLSEINNLVEEFQQGTSTLFGSKYLSYNLHILSHISESLKFLGPNSNVSSYPLEDYMGQLKSKVRRYSHAGPALIRVFMNDFRFKEYVETKIKKWNLVEKEKKFFGLDEKDSKTTKLVQEKIPDKMINIIIEVLNDKYEVQVNPIDLKIFKTIRFRGIRYSTRNYCEKKLRNDAFIRSDEKFYSVEAICEFKAKVLFICRQLETKVTSLSFNGFTGFFSFKLDNTFAIIKESTNYHCVEIESVSTKCIHINSISFHWTNKTNFVIVPFLQNK
ncbi:uncharacterized protein LOC128388826 [Panonychus citri]|uniref:uncharacterized protein LOC128388826 n=1 Tax=Panonychus citri TaxID=50023 RepID=UPI002307A08B|nr:uncharacterized protein LOC128388826 [Panonychus citri]